MKSAIASVSILAALCVVAAAFPPEYMKKISGYIETCTAKHGTNKADVLKLLAEHKVPDTQEMKCTVDCYLTEAGYLKEGKLDWDQAKESHKEKYADDQESLEKADKIVDICKEEVNIEGKKECEVSEVLLKCLFEQAEKLGLKTPDFAKAKSE